MDSVSQTGKLIQALLTLKEECKLHNRCIGCPLKLENGSCGVTERYPEAYEILDEPRTVNYCFDV